MNVFEWLQSIIPSDVPELVQALGIALIIILIYDTYHLFFSAVFSLFKK